MKNFLGHSSILFIQTTSFHEILRDYCVERTNVSVRQIASVFGCGPRTIFSTPVLDRVRFLPMTAALLGSVLVDPFLVLDDAEAEMDLWTPRWFESPPLRSAPPRELPLATCAPWFEVVPLWGAPPTAPPIFWGSMVRNDKDDPDRLPSLSA